MAEVVQVHTERIFITAERARQFLKNNFKNNRPLNMRRINDYARDMKSGHWRENGDTIKLSADGEMIDGQHRCAASVQCGIGFWSLVAYGIQKEAFVTIDRNQSRSTGQVLHLESGVSDYNALSGALSWLWRFRDGIMLATMQPTSSEAAELLQEHPQLKDSLMAARQVIKRFKAGSAATVAVVHYLFTRQDATLAELFFDSLASGASLQETDPVYQLRFRLISAAGSATKRIGAYELIALYFKAWIAEREQRKMGILRWATTEAFPNIGPITEAKHRPEKIEAPAPNRKVRTGSALKMEAGAV
jgi:hypothetical protein